MLEKWYWKCLDRLRMRVEGISITIDFTLSRQLAFDCGTKRNILFDNLQQIVAFNRTLIEKSAVAVPATRGTHFGLPLQRCRNTKTDYILGQIFPRFWGSSHRRSPDEKE
ncbi:hypothetical protein ACFOY8_15300 [Thalassospira xianhensis]|uniref:hypothetical protein n=1 Tax=Thalassospira xianhensis TaxID=478503 RepID=UPI0011BF04E7|nr:hypothetical protein [Thalassospira xianhensis]UKV13376.1 hypothetical protein L6172_15145 [Thalassospiraceae bacterium SW-3-3]